VLVEHNARERLAAIVDQEVAPTDGRAEMDEQPPS
jgi:hypothetical protein